ncbi:MAG: HAMP domain-containing protein [Oscillospiraceae bacterium]|nr:HAMP domain-containing protein [Oscillospiraceae bacterium]
MTNIYPVINMRTMLYESKKSEMQNQESVIASSLAPLGKLSADDVEKVMYLIGDMNLTRIIITDTSATVLYDSSDNEGNKGKYALLPEILSALEGKSSFSYEFTSEATKSRASQPIMYRGKNLGAVYIYEYSTEEAELVMALRGNLGKISIGVFVLAILLAFFLSAFLNGRLRSIVRAIKGVAAGNYGSRIDVKGNDELDELSREFNALTDRLQKTEELRQRFVSDASHELKTPLAGIRLLSDSIVQNDNIPPELLREFVVDIGQEAERLTRITEKLLELTRLDVKRQEIKNAVDVGQVINESMKMLRTLAENKDVTVGCELEDNCIIWANSDDIHQIVFNLVENAIKYNVVGGNVKVFLYMKESMVNLIIDDTGVGIPQEDLPHIFDRFYRVDKARNSDVGGSGLGLSIVKDTVEKHGGSVEAFRREVGGTRFMVSFPCYKEDDHA